MMPFFGFSDRVRRMRENCLGEVWGVLGGGEGEDEGTEVGMGSEIGSVVLALACLRVRWGGSGGVGRGWGFLYGKGFEDCGRETTTSAGRGHPGRSLNRPLVPVLHVMCLVGKVDELVQRRSVEIRRYRTFKESDVVNVEEAK